MQELQNLVNEREDKAQELEQILNERQEEADEIVSDFSKKVDELADRVTAKMNEIEISVSKQVADVKRVTEEQLEANRKLNENQIAASKKLGEDQIEVIKDAKSQPLFGLETLPVYFLAWTTTPWTLSSNTALCVGPNIEYVRVKSFNPYTGAEAIYVVAKALVSEWFSPKAAGLALEDYKPGDKLIPFKVLDGTFKGSELAGIRYHQLIPWFKPIDGDAFRVITGDYVSTDEGTTGIVHIAPTFGADDKKVATAAGIGPMMVIDKNGNHQPLVDHDGRFFPLEDLDPEYVAANVSPEYKEYAGRYVKNAFDDTLPADAPTLDVDLCMMMKMDGRAFRSCSMPPAALSRPWS